MNWLKKPSTTGGIVYLVVLGSVLVGVGIAAAGAWRTGCTVMGLSFAAAFVMRMLLPDERAGMLGIRRRLVDLTTLAVCSGLLLVLAAVIPARRL